MDKVRKEKKALEQRQKNFQLVSTTAKKEREEIDNLRREYAKYKNDAELKAKKQQGTIERLTKQNNELKQKNKELLEDLKAMEQQRIILERSGPNREPVTNTLNRSTTA
jgi:DNA repair exonuclease SbcCD ATPase subunit